MGHRQIKAAKLDIKDLYHEVAIDLQAPTPLVVIAVRQIVVIFTNTRQRASTLAKRRRVFGWKG